VAYKQQKRSVGKEHISKEMKPRGRRRGRSAFTKEETRKSISPPSFASKESVLTGPCEQPIRVFSKWDTPRKNGPWAKNTSHKR
jgi:hypothetical protein